MSGCNNCPSCLKLKKKIEIYEKFMDQIKEVEETDSKHIFEDSIIIEKDNYGDKIKKLRSNLGDSFLIIDNCKELDELDNSEYDAIHQQNKFRNWQEAEKVMDKAGIMYTVGKYALSLGKWFLIL